MLAVQILEIKNFMHTLFKTDAFAHFLLTEATIVNGVTYNIDGHITRYDSDSTDDHPYEYMPFGTLKPKVYELIKGARTPQYLKFVFTLTPENTTNTLQSISSSTDTSELSGLYINITFKSGKLMATTGVSYKVFKKDTSLEQEWDRLVRLFFQKNNVYFESM